MTKLIQYYINLARNGCQFSQNYLDAKGIDWGEETEKEITEKPVKQAVRKSTKKRTWANFTLGKVEKVITPMYPKKRGTF